MKVPAENYLEEGQDQVADGEFRCWANWNTVRRRLGIAEAALGCKEREQFRKTNADAARILQACRYGKTSVEQQGYS
ncbi:hypothetical protein CW304_23410 [Bacillus sp. UFRGS-B20]|nr:hypothetical protein CW304_23410 [Bacillus sp. UFRGS-B20]